MSSRAPSSSRSSTMSAVASSAVHARAGQRGLQPVEQLGPVGHGVGAARGTESAPRAGWSQATIISRPSSGDARRRGGALLGRAARRPRSAAGRARISVQRRRRWPAKVVIGVSPFPRSRVSISSGVGMAVEHSSREATMAPAALARCSSSSRGQPASRPWAQRAAEAVTGAQAVQRRDRDRRRHDPLGRGSWPSTPLGPLLHDGQLHAGVEQRVGRALGVGLADRDLALLAVADRDGDLRRGPSGPGRGRARGVSQNIGR